ncbi:hypothetical protein L6164_037646 [Bauhinia variegata]|uniref:Uncharacterized protein n=1 Tax=Bauhinia variegata TaxID=167791 RepID=A0ACB9KL94_BAUVA|nr:hypothetical protein L6164_037646 [Bauhinia variegata]
MLFSAFRVDHSIVGTKEEVKSCKGMAHNGKVIPNCVYASNPYHECTDACLTKLKDGPPQKQKKNSGVIPLKFGRKKKLGSKPELPVLDSIPPSKVGAIYFSDVSYSEKKKDGLKSSERISSKPISGEVNYKDPSSNMEQPRSPKSEPESRNDMPVNHKDKAMDSDELCPNPIQTYNEEKKNASHKVVPHPTDTDDLITRATGRMDFSFSGASISNEDSDDEETESVVSESRVPIGRYHVKGVLLPFCNLSFTSMAI